MAPLKKDIYQIFDMFETQAQVLESFQQKLVVPGERAGSFYLSTSKSEIEGLAKINSIDETTNKAYEHILPLGYVPRRLFAKHSNEKITFAFSAKGDELKEVLISDKEYKTSNGIGIGSSLETVKKFFPDGKLSNQKDRTYWVSKGISFIFEKSVLSEMVIFK